MRNLIKQIKKSLNYNLYFSALFPTLSLPDICGAIESKNGKASRKKYKSWFNKYVGNKYCFNGADCYYFRCSLLHQGSSQHKNNTYKRVIFIEPSAKHKITCHNNILNNALNIDIKIFCEDMVKGVEKWLEKNEGTQLYKKNYNKFMRRHPNGLSPYIKGVPVIS